MIDIDNLPKKYGSWAGDPDGALPDPARCVVKVWSIQNFGVSYQCTRKRGRGPRGLFCKQHAKMHIAAQVERGEIPGCPLSETLTEEDTPMAETKHTPGPWRVDTRREVHQPGDIMAGDVTVAKPHGPDGDWADVEAIHQANARLIAAAPELFEIAEHADALGNHTCGDVYNDGTIRVEVDVLDELVAFARIVLAKVNQSNPKAPPGARPAVVCGA